METDILANSDAKYEDGIESKCVDGIASKYVDGTASMFTVSISLSSNQYIVSESNYRRFPSN